MATSPKTSRSLTIEEFLKRPSIDERPTLAYIDGRIEAKPLAQVKHCVIQAELASVLNRFARPIKLGMAFPGLRFTFAGRSIVPDLVFLPREHIERDEWG